MPCTPSNPLRTFTSLSSISIPWHDYIDVISVRHFGRNSVFLPQQPYLGITSKSFNLAEQGLGGKMNYKIMLPNDNIFNLITLIVITLIGLWSEELAATLTVLAYSLRIYQEVSNLNLKPSELHRRQEISRKHYAILCSLSF